MKTSNNPGPSRRSVLLGVTVFAATAGLNSIAAGTAFAAPGGKLQTSNGWPVLPADTDPRLTTFVVEGTGTPLTVAAGDPAIILSYVVRRFHYEVSEIQATELKGYIGASTNMTAQQLINSSGTAIDIKPEIYPLDVTGGFFPAETLVIRDILAQCEGVIRWGGDNLEHPQESHFEICVGPGEKKLKDVAARLQTDLAYAGRGPGTDMDAPQRPERRQRAQELRAAQGGKQ